MSYQRDCPDGVRVGVVGVGLHCYRNVLPVLNFLPVQRQAVCDLDNELAAATAAQYGVAGYTSAPEMFREVELDAVILCAPPEQHASLAVQAFDAGLYVFEKRSALGVSGVCDMLRARGDRRCVVGYKKMFMPAARKVREILDAHGGRAAA